MVKAIEVANFLLNLSKPNTKESISNLKLQKLLYYVQGFHLAFYNDRLFEDDIQAWSHGPVVPDVYREFKGNSYRDIQPSPLIKESDLDRRKEDLIREVWEVFKGFDGKELEKMSHEETPWKNARGDLPEYASSMETIPIENIRDFFREEYVKN
ncbi:Panacea domain-containing protein [Jeotgalibacillus soli]|uniref:Antitoxin SocA-like Panacea domain-containing protein n=1 Tax=Jeotgalibacillus soli TaxID=889306 RepID=A0A0C2VMQ8_9BACL|nr:type II toxin-antitoxin system antitoxin SocA domain-containing protein [Jeotgalibacillus soli]KIL45726.1 hypothetical protein KP78_20750 [Jeotgalibacillus soli]